MNKIKVRIMGEMHQEGDMFLVSSLQVADRFIFAPESGIAKGELHWGNVFCCRGSLNIAEIPLQHGPEAAPAECPLHFCGMFLVSPEQQRPLPFLYPFRVHAFVRVNIAGNPDKSGIVTLHLAPRQRFLQSGVKLMCVKQGEREPKWPRKRIQVHCFAFFLQRFVGATQSVKQIRTQVVCFRIVRIEFDGAPKLLVRRFPVPFVLRQNDSQRNVSVGEIRVEVLPAITGGT